ncbi:hypothetical protein HA402_002375 [Bradysia odoriphaga]|nr:hypothetical protein HA402_002375 [Bradysia odoriphaga]
MQPIAQREEIIAVLLTFTIEKFYVKQCNNIFVYGNRVDPAHNAILQQMFGALDRNIAVTWILHDKDYLDGNTDRMANIVLIDSYESFRSVWKSITTTSLFHFGYYTVALTKVYQKEDLNSELNNIFNEFWQSMIVNTNILAYSDDDKQSLSLHTYFPFAASHCRKIVPIIWDNFKIDHSVQNEKQLFPFKTNDLFQCPLSILVMPYRPYISVTKNGSHGIHVYGIEYNVLHELSQRMNFQLNFSFYPGPLGIIHDNGTSTGLWKLVSERKYDMGSAGLVATPLPRKILSFTKPFSYDNVVLVLPNPTPYSAFETLFFPFTLTSWILLALTIVIGTAAIKLLECNRKLYYKFIVGTGNPNPYFNLFSALLNGNAFYLPNGTLARFLLMVWILTSMVVRTMYLGQLFTFIKMNKTVPSAANIDELINRRITITLDEDGYGQFFKFDQRLEKLLNFYNMSADTGTDYDFVAETDAYVLLETRLVSETLRKSSEQRLNLPKPKTIRIISTAHVIMLPQRFYLKDTMDEIITEMNEFGLTSNWDGPFKEAALVNNVDKNIQRKLNMSQILGLVQIWLGLLILSTVVFILEVLCYYSVGHANVVQTI